MCSSTTLASWSLSSWRCLSLVYSSWDTLDPTCTDPSRWDTLHLICHEIQCESKKSLLQFSGIFSKWLGIFNQFFYTPINYTFQSTLDYIFSLWTSRGCTTLTNWNSVCSKCSVMSTRASLTMQLTSGTSVIEHVCRRTADTWSICCRKQYAYLHSTVWQHKLSFLSNKSRFFIFLL